MDYQIPFPDPAQTWFSGMDQGCIDPSLKNYTVQDNTAPWSFPQAHRYSYLHDNNDNSAFANNGNGRLEGVAPVPPASYNPGRGASFDQQSSICSSDSLQFGNSEHGFDPATPSDGMLSPPATYDQWHQGGQGIYLSDLSVVKNFDLTSGCQEPLQMFHDEDVKFTMRASSMSSDCSTYETGLPSQQPSPSTSTETSSVELSHPIKEEIFVSDHYPSPPDNEEYEDASEQDSEQPNVGDEDDEDYKPNKRGGHKRIASSTSRTQRKRSNASQPSSPSKRVKREQPSSSAQRSMPKVSSIARGAFSCSECREASFKDQASLQRHIKQQHTRPFVCVFHFAQCESTFASKNEWKRHVASQHLLLNYWLCQQDGCAKLSNTSGSLTKPTGTSRHRNANNIGSQGACSFGGLPNGAIFNRKDLYTQHLRRMHSPPTVKKQAKAKKSVPEWEDRVRSCQTEAHKLRCALPEYMRCPMPGCDFEAVGHTAWDERMEHVAKHLEKAANGEEAQIMFGGDNDPTLMNWVLRSDVAVVKDDGPGKWALNNPLKPDRSAGSRASAQVTFKHETDDDYDDEQDAPGELDD